MIIELEVQNETPLCIADALIKREIKCRDYYGALTARENLRQIGLALLNQVESSERLEGAMGDADCPWK